MHYSEVAQVVAGGRLAPDVKGEVRKVKISVYPANEYLQHEKGRYLPTVNSPWGLLEFLGLKVP